MKVVFFLTVFFAIVPQVQSQTNSVNVIKEGKSFALNYSSTGQSAITQTDIITGKSDTIVYLLYNDTLVNVQSNDTIIVFMSVSSKIATFSYLKKENNEWIPFRFGSGLQIKSPESGIAPKLITFSYDFKLTSTNSFSCKHLFRHPNKDAIYEATYDLDFLKQEFNTLSYTKIE